MRDIIWVDLETGGLDHNVHSPLSFAMMHTRDETILNRWGAHIRQAPLVVTPDALKTNKIDLLRKGCTYAEFCKAYWSVLNSWCYTDKAGKYVKPYKDIMPFWGGQNVGFDRPWLHMMLGDTWDGIYYHSVDTMVLASTLQATGLLPPSLPDLKLETLVKYFGIEVPEGDLHDAMVDIEMCFEVWKEMKRLLLSQ